MSVILGVATNDVKGMSRSWQYSIWINMIKRCYSNTATSNPSYKGCTVSDNFLVLSKFVAWLDEVGKPPKGWCLDKDVLGDGTVYSEDICCFIPPIINLVFKRHNVSSTGLPVGVSQQPGSGRFKASRGMYSKVVCLGTYGTPEEAHAAYLQATEEYIQELAEEYKADLSDRVYSYLSNYKV